MMSYRKPLQKLTLADLGLADDAVRAANGAFEVVELAVPVKEVRCELVQGDTLEERVDALAQRIAAVVNGLG